MSQTPEPIQPDSAPGENPPAVTQTADPAEQVGPPEDDMQVTDSDGSEPDLLTPERISVAYGNIDTTDLSWRSRVERNLDERLPSGKVWLYEWGRTEMAITPVEPDSPEAARKAVANRLRIAAEGAVAKGATASVVKQTRATITGWDEASGHERPIPRGMSVAMGDADMSDKRAQTTIESTLDRALGTEMPALVWLYAWTHSTPTTLDCRAVPRESVEGRRKIAEVKLRNVVMSKFRTPRTAEPPSVHVTDWGAPSGLGVFTEPDPNHDWDAEPREVEVTFGAVDVTRQDTRQAFQLHVDSTVEGVHDWRYEWNPQLGRVHLLSVPALPTYVRFPDEDSPEAQQWHSDFRKGKIALGPAKGGFMPVLDLSKSPHMLVGGSTGAGKSYLLNLIIYGALFNVDAVELAVIDPKATDFTWSAAYPNVRAYAVRDARTAVEEIREVVTMAHKEMMARQNLLNAFGAEDMEQLREFCRTGRVTPDELRLEDVPKRFILFFDEGGSAFTTSKDAELKAFQDESRTLMEQMAMLARVMEVNIVMAAQKPSAQNIGTAMREQLVIRIAVGYLNTDTSIQVLGNTMATDLLNGAGKGRGVLADDQGNEQVFQTFYLPRVTSPDVIDGDANPIEGIQERVAAQLENHGYMSVPKNVTVNVRSVDKVTGDETIREVQRLTNEWVSPDMVES